MTRGAARRALRSAATRWPTLTYAVVGAAASASAPLPSAGRLLLILPNLEAREVRKARRRLRSSEWKSRALGVVMNTATTDPVFPHVEVDGPLPDPGSPTILVSLHVGAMQSPPLQWMLWQSAACTQPAPVPHAGQVPPPQSGAVSLAFFTPSAHVGA